MPSLQGSMSLGHPDNPDILEAEQSRLIGKEAEGEEKGKIVDSKIVPTPHIEKNKDSSKFELSATYFFSSIYRCTRTTKW